MLKIFLTNLGKYNEGELIGEWINLPYDSEKLESVKRKIGITAQYEEWFITDFETDIDGLKISEFDSIDNLNEMAEILEGLNESETEVVEALISYGFDVKTAIENIDDCIVYFNCSCMADVAEQYADETGFLEKIPENLRYYFDFEAYGRDMEIEGQFVFTKNGNCVQIL